MAWGLWNKIKNGIKRVGGVLKRGAEFVRDKVIKPFKPVISGVATAINPAFGAALTTGMNVAEKLTSGDLKQGAVDAVNWAKSRWKT